MFIRAFADHGLNGEGVPRLHHTSGLAVLEMEDVRSGVKDLSQSMSAEFSYGGKPFFSDMFFNNRADILVGPPGFAKFDSFLPGVVGDFDQFFSGFVYLTDAEGFGAVPVVAFIEHGYIDIDNISVLEDGGHVGDPVTDHFVQARAAGFGEAVIVQGRGVGASFDRFTVHDHVDFVRGHPNFDLTGHRVENFAGNQAGGTHGGDVFGALDFDHPGQGRVAGFGDTVIGCMWGGWRRREGGRMLE